MNQILDPRTIPQSDYDVSPFFVSKGGGTDIMSKLIRWRTKSWCEHSMLSINPGKFVWESASNWYGEGKMDSYLVPNNKLVFYQLVNCTPETTSALRQYVYNRINSPWWNKMYDYVGILGEALGTPKIHTPGLEYCSVDDIHALKTIAPTLPHADQLIINSIPDEENPGYLDMVMLNAKTVFKEYGVYQYPSQV